VIRDELAALDKPDLALGIPYPMNSKVRSQYEAVIGLEIHAEMLTRSKMFCGCALVDLTLAEPNTSVCEICTGMPGTLPVINERAVEFALRVALALDCQIAERSVFARKNYFYPDLPKGYQISQYELPLASGGFLPIETPDGEKRINIRRVHLEEDTGKLFHEDGFSLVDFNRAGVPLLEIVSEPELASLEEVKAYATTLRSLLRYLEVNSGDMDKGVIRFEANVSIRPPGSRDLSTRTEIKNLNSFRSMLRAVEFELERQSSLTDQGVPIIQETLGWDETTGETVSQRSKEEAHDYRYFPEPDLPPLVLDPGWIAEIRRSLPELPFVKQNRYVLEMRLSPYLAQVIAAEKEVAEFFEAAVSGEPELPPSRIANWLTSELFGILNEVGLSLAETKITPLALARLVAMVERGEINTTSAKSVLGEIVRMGGDPQDIVSSLGVGIVKDRTAITAWVEQVLHENPEQVEQYLSGKHALEKWLLGQVMRTASGRAEPTLARDILLESLSRWSPDTHA